MKTLVVDDLRILRDKDATYARSLELGMHLALTEEWDELYLDHDLGVDTDIKPLVYALGLRAEEGSPAPIAKIYIITGNPVAAKWMERALDGYNVERIPYFNADMLSFRDSLDCVAAEHEQLAKLYEHLGDWRKDGGENQPKAF